MKVYGVRPHPAEYAGVENVECGQTWIYLWTQVVYAIKLGKLGKENQLFHHFVCFTQWQVSYILLSDRIFSRVFSPEKSAQRNSFPFDGHEMIAFR